MENRAWLRYSFEKYLEVHEGSMGAYYLEHLWTIVVGGSKHWLPVHAVGGCTLWLRHGLAGHAFPDSVGYMAHSGVSLTVFRFVL